jgi:hypothetical protein
MRGSPMLHLLLLMTAFVLLSVPLRHLTGAVRASGENATGAAAGVVEGVDEHPEGEHVHRVPVRIRVRYSGRPESMQLKVGERNLLEGVAVADGVALDCEAELELGHDGNELVLEVKWPAGEGETAVTVELEPEGLEGRSETRWADGGAISDVLTFVW